MFTIKRENKKFIIRNLGVKIAIRETEKEARHTVDLLSTYYKIKPGHVFIEGGQKYEYFIEKEDVCYINNTATSYKKYGKNPQKLRESHKKCLLRKNPNTLFIEDVERVFEGVKVVTKHDIAERFRITTRRGASYLRHLYIRRAKREKFKEVV